MSRSNSFTTLTQEEKGRITDERNKLIREHQGVAIGWSKGVYQNQGEPYAFIMRDMFAETCNVFGVKQVDARHFVVDVLKTIQLHQSKLLMKQTYAAASIRAISKCKLPNLPWTTENNWTIECVHSKETPFVKLMNIKDGEERNGVNCFIKELLMFARFINSKILLVDDTILQTSTIRNDLADSDLF